MESFERDRSYKKKRKKREKRMGEHKRREERERRVYLIHLEFEIRLELSCGFRCELTAQVEILFFEKLRSQANSLHFFFQVFVLTLKMSTEKKEERKERRERRR